MATGIIPKNNIFLLQSTTLNTSHNITVPNASAHLLLAYGGALNTYRIFWVATTSSGILDAVEISSGDGSTMVTSNNTVTITYPTARYLYLIDIPVFGGACSI